MSEIVSIVVAAGEVIETVIVEEVQDVSIYVSEFPTIEAGRISKLFYTATGDEGGQLIIPGISSAQFTQVTQGAIPLKEVASDPGDNQYSISGNNIVFGSDPVVGENILIIWQ